MECFYRNWRCKETRRYEWMRRSSHTWRHTLLWVLYQLQCVMIAYECHAATSQQRYRHQDDCECLAIGGALCRSYRASWSTGWRSTTWMWRRNRRNSICWRRPRHATSRGCKNSPNSWVPWSSSHHDLLKAIMLTALNELHPVTNVHCAS